MALGFHFLLISNAHSEKRLSYVCEEQILKNSKYSPSKLKLIIEFEEKKSLDKFYRIQVTQGKINKYYQYQDGVIINIDVDQKWKMNIGLTLQSFKNLKSKLNPLLNIYGRNLALTHQFHIEGGQIFGSIDTYPSFDWLPEDREFRTNTLKFFPNHHRESKKVNLPKGAIGYEIGNKWIQFNSRTGMLTKIVTSIDKAFLKHVFICNKNIKIKLKELNKEIINEVKELNLNDENILIKNIFLKLAFNSFIYSSESNHEKISKRLLSFINKFLPELKFKKERKSLNNFLLTNPPYDFEKISKEHFFKAISRIQIMLENI